VDDSSFLRAILEDPLDDGPRLVWADALDERGDPRGEFVRVQCELARIDGELSEHNSDSKGTCICRRCVILRKAIAPLRRRERELYLANWEPWTEDIRSALKPLSYGPESCTLPDSSQARWNFRRGLVGSVTLTAEQFLGGPCERCRGSGRSRNQYGEDTGFKCIVCHGTGRVEGLAAALFRAAPITEVRLSDREPDAISDGRLAWWYTDPDWHRPGLHQHHWLPVELRPHLTGRICEPVDEPRPGVCGFDYGDSFEGTDGVGLARADCSAACVAAGRARANLPALARPASADSPR
jgi:uncharacterized protein (TIGR02996 family)